MSNSLTLITLFSEKFWHSPLAAIVTGGTGFVVGSIAGWLVSPRHKPSKDASSPRNPPSFAPELSQRELAPESPRTEPSAPEPQFDQFILAVVDTIDEIELMKSNSTVEAARGLALVQGRLEDNVELADGELIREKLWQPDLQRATKVEPTELGQTEIRVLRTRATGLKHQGRMIRKQEVVISRP